MAPTTKETRALLVPLVLLEPLVLLVPDFSGRAPTAVRWGTADLHGGEADVEQDAINAAAGAKRAFHRFGHLTAQQSAL
jgi:hypothetical protein